MNSEDINIYIDYKEYDTLFNSNAEQITVRLNLDKITFYETLINYFIEKDSYFNYLKEALSRRKNINLVVEQNDIILLKKTIAPAAIVLGIKTKEETLQNDFKRKFKVLLNKIDIDNYLNNNYRKTYTINVDGKKLKFLYGQILDVILDSGRYNEIINTRFKYLGINPREFVYVLKNFLIDKHILITFALDSQAVTYYKTLIQSFDTFAINKYQETEFKYSADVSIDKDFANYILSEMPKNISLLEKTIYAYMNMFQLLKYDEELVDDKIVKKHKDLTRIQDINIKNNMIFSYEFSCLFAKILEKLGLKFEYNDKYIIARINYFVIKYKSMTPEFNLKELSQFDIIKEITLLNDNKNTKDDFNKIISKIYDTLYQKKVDIEIAKMPFNKLLAYYKKTSNKISVSFEKKYEIFLKLISNVTLDANAMGYIYELKTIIFNEDELNSNISFATVAEQYGKKVNPAVIITVNNININLYNSNKYVYYNPPSSLETYNLNEIRLHFFNGRFKYIKKSRDNIIGVEKNNIC